ALAAQNLNLPKLRDDLVGLVSLVGHCGPPSGSKPYFKVDPFNGGGSRARPGGHADRHRPWRHSAGLWHGTWAAARRSPSIPLPTPFSTVMPSNPLGVPGVELHAAASPQDADRPAPVWRDRTQEQDSGPRQAHEPVARPTALRTSAAPGLVEEDDLR